MRNFVLFVLFVFLISPIYSLTVYAPKAPPTIPLLRTAEVMPDIRVVLYDDVQSEVLPKILRESGSLYIIPSNMAAKLYGKGTDIRLMGITTLGLLYLISADSGVNQFSDLNGKKVWIGEAGSSPDVVARHLFQKKGLKPVIAYSSTPEIAKFLIGGKIGVAVLPEPYASMVLASNPSARRIGDLKQIWEKTEPDSAGIPQTALAGKSGFIKNNREAIDRFLFNYRESVSWTMNLPQRSSELGVKKLGLKMTAQTLAGSIPYMNLTYIGGKEGAKMIADYFRALMETDPLSVGEKIPDENFFTE